MEGRPGSRTGAVLGLLWRRELNEYKGGTFSSRSQESYVIGSTVLPRGPGLMNLIQRRHGVKTMLLMLILLLLPAIVFAGDTCASIGGVCQPGCRQDEIQQEGIFPDCYKQYCCTPRENKPVSKGESTKTKSTDKLPDRPVSEESSSGAETRGSSEAPGNIIVCFPLQDTYANPESSLKCGDKETTLNDLYEQNYRLIQIVPGEKTLYYLEKKGAAE
jgi:hypothetical protein